MEIPRKIDVKWINESTIQEASKQFLKQHKSYKIPVPLEEIAELKLKIRVLTIPNLKKVFECDGFISSDFSNMAVDEGIYNGYIPRFRFTLAHELGHLILHKDAYEKLGISNLDSYMRAQNSIDPKIWKKLEFQADLFAGATLFPIEYLKASIDKKVQSFGGVENMSVTELRLLANSLTEEFQASEQACGIQLNKHFPELIKVASQF